LKKVAIFTIFSLYYYIVVRFKQKLVLLNFALVYTINSLSVHKSVQSIIHIYFSFKEVCPVEVNSLEVYPIVLTGWGDQLWTAFYGPAAARLWGAVSIKINKIL
jgi:hypothetical protein